MKAAPATERTKLTKEIRLLRHIVTSLENYTLMAHALDVDEHVDLYREWLQEAIAEREAL